MIPEEMINNSKSETLLKELENNKNNVNILKKIVEELNKRIKENRFSFTKEYSRYLYIYMFACNKVEQTETLSELIKGTEFIKLLDGTDIDGSMIIALTNDCTRPRTKLLIESSKIRKSILGNDKLLTPSDILSDLTKEEIQILREDIEIDNYLIANGLSFDTLRTETVDRILNEINLLSLYNIKTINEFANSFEHPEYLIENETFLNLYMSKLTDEYYYENKIFKYLDQKSLDYILSNYKEDYVLLHLAKDTIGDIQKEILKRADTEAALNNTYNDFILSKIPTKSIVKIILSKNDLLSLNNQKLFTYLDKKEISSIYSKKEELYKNLIDELKSSRQTELDILVNSLPLSLYNDLTDNQINDFSIESLIKLLEINNNSFKKVILKNQQLINKLIKETKIKNFNKFEKLFEIGEFTPEEKIRFVNNINDFNNPKMIIKFIETVPSNYRKTFVENKNLRNILLSEDSYELDDYLVNYLLNHPNELKNLSSKVIVTILENSDFEFVKKVLSNTDVLKKILETNENQYIDEILKNSFFKKELLPLFTEKKLTNYYTPETLQNILSQLTIKEKNYLCSNELIKHIIKDEESNKLYKSLLNKNGYLLNTVDFRFLNANVKGLRINVLETITKYPELQDLILRIDKYFKVIPEFISYIFYKLEDLGVEVITSCLRVLCDSCEGNNRKNIGNIPKMYSIVENVSKSDYESIINYLLYLIPRFQNNNTNINRPVYLDTPNTYNDINSYEIKTNDELSNLFASAKDTNKKSYFIAKHFKLSLEEAKKMISLYDISRIDAKVYKEEYEFLNNLNKVMNTDEESLSIMDYDYKVISMYDSFAIENKIKRMYGKIFNYEVRSKSYLINYTEKKLYGKTLKIYDCPNDFLLLISNMNYIDELHHTNSYFEAWHNNLNEMAELDVSLISNDHIVLNNDITFAFNGVMENGIKLMANKRSYGDDITFTTPRSLIDNTRDINNTLLIDRLALRPNYNNSNIPNIEPDFIIINKEKIDDETFLENVLRASEEFKTKRNKDGLPVIAIDLEKMSNNELDKITQLCNKYHRNHDMNLIVSILTKLENNYTSYRNYSPYLAKKFDINIILDLIKNRIQNSNSYSELNFIEEVFTNEYNKYNNLTNTFACNFDLKELKELIKERKEIIDK